MKEVSLLLLAYGVHTSLKIPPSTWFRHLALGRAIAPESCPQQEGKRRNRKNHGIIVITSLRS